MCASREREQAQADRNQEQAENHHEDTHEQKQSLISGEFVVVFGPFLCLRVSAIHVPQHGGKVDHGKAVHQDHDRLRLCCQQSL